MSVTEDYCSFELNKLLKEKGFDAPVNMTYDTKGIIAAKWIDPSLDYISRDWMFPRVTHQMALKWLREVHKININVLYDLQRFIKTNGTTENVGVYEVDVITENGTIYIGNWNHHESACEAAIKYCLTNLI